MMATRNARADVMTLLLDLGADIDAQCAVRTCSPFYGEYVRVSWKRFYPGICVLTDTILSSDRTIPSNDLHYA